MFDITTKMIRTTGGSPSISYLRMDLDRLEMPRQQETTKTVSLSAFKLLE